jgi:hypothetical protein
VPLVAPPRARVPALPDELEEPLRGRLDRGALEETTGLPSTDCSREQMVQF